MRRFRIRPKARRDLNDTARNLLETLGAAKAEQFQASALQTFLDLVRMPKIGAPRTGGSNPRRDMRMWRIREYEEYLVFYSVDAEFLSIDRIIHAKRDYNRQRL